MKPESAKSELAPLDLAAKRSGYALKTFGETWAVSLKRFMPLFLAWVVSLALPVVILCITVFGGLVIDWSVFHASKGGWATVIGLLLPGLFIGGLWGGWNYITLKVVRDLPVKVGDMFRPFPQMMSALMVLAITSSLCWIPVVGWYLFLRWQLAAFYIVDRGYGPIKALQKSWHDTDMVFFPLLMLDLMLLGVGAVFGAITFMTVIGPLAIHIAFTTASAIVYSKWLTDENNPDIPQRLEDLS